MINISKLLWRFKEFFLFFISSTTIYKIHAPFAFRLVQQVFEDKSNYYAFPLIESYRNQLKKSKNSIKKIEFGAGENPTRSISNLANIDSSPSVKGQQLFKLVNHLQPKSILELGTCIGIGTSYLGHANSASTLQTIEACPNTIKIAEDTLKSCGVSHPQLHNMTFDNYIDQLHNSKTKFDLIYIDGHHNEEATLRYFERLKPFMDSQNCTVIFDDIYWSKGMKRAWQEVKKDDTFKLSIDLFHIGIIFRNNNLRSRSSFKLVKAAWKPWINGFFSKNHN
jgi:predicted O-methyltransferase YrrM